MEMLNIAALLQSKKSLGLIVTRVHSKNRPGNRIQALTSEDLDHVTVEHRTPGLTFTSFTKLMLILFAPFWLQVSQIHAQTAEIQTQSIVNPASSKEQRPVEQITVIGMKQLRAVHYQLERAESKMYHLFNDLNSSNEFDIHCKQQTRGDTQIRRRYCEPVFIKKLQSRFTQRMPVPDFFNINQLPSTFGSVVSLTQSEEMKMVAAEKYEILQEEMHRIAMENPEYRQHLIRVGELQTEYNNMRNKSIL